MYPIGIPGQPSDKNNSSKNKQRVLILEILNYCLRAPIICHKYPSIHFVPMSNYEIAELTWKNGQLGMNGLLQTKSSTLWQQGQGHQATGRTSETLESIVHQATWQQNNSGSDDQIPSSGVRQRPDVLMKKRTRSESDYGALSVKGSNCMEIREVMSETNNNNMSTTCWANSFDSSPSFKHNKTAFDDSASLGGSENQDGDGETTRTETVKSGSNRRSRAASVHNQSERRRRDRINQKMKALQKLVPNASKTDKASMLDEVIDYLKQLQAQVQVMSSVRNNMNMNMPAAQMNMMMSLQQQQQQQNLQMSLLAARMGLGIGIGTNPTSTTSFLTPPFLLPSIIHPHPNSQPPQPTQLQSMNMEVYNKMAQLYQQHQVNHTTHRINQ